MNVETEMLGYLGVLGGSDVSGIWEVYMCPAGNESVVVI